MPATVQLMIARALGSSNIVASSGCVASAATWRWLQHLRCMSALAEQVSDLCMHATELSKPLACNAPPPPAPPS